MAPSEHARRPLLGPTPTPSAGCCGHQAPGGSGGERAAFRARLPADHVLATLMDEHSRLLAHLDQLEGLLPHLPAAESAVFARIEAIGQQLIGAEPHHQREEQVLFPSLREHGIDGPPDVMQAEHVELRSLKHKVADLAAKAGRGDGTAPGALRLAMQDLVSMLRAHIDKEDSILYPIAFASIAEAEWGELKARCDAVGYCCQH